MPYVQGRHDGRALIIHVAIIDAARYHEHKQSQNPILSAVRPYSALIDTGASSTMITDKVVEDLGLEPVGKIPFFDLDGLTYKTAYLFHVAFYDTVASNSLQMDDGDQDIVEVANPISRIHVCTGPIHGGKIDGTPSFDVLLGMDIIRTGALKIEKSGHFSFAF